MGPNENSQSSGFTYHKKDDNTYTVYYDRVLTAMNMLDTLYNLNMPRMYEPVIEGKYTATGDTRIIPIAVEHKEEEIQWVCNMSISVDIGDPETLKEAMTRTNGHLWKLSRTYAGLG